MPTPLGAASLRDTLEDFRDRCLRESQLRSPGAAADAFYEDYWQLNALLNNMQIATLTTISQELGLKP
jgi:hypothetical protein